MNTRNLKPVPDVQRRWNLLRLRNRSMLLGVLILLGAVLLLLIRFGLISINMPQDAGPTELSSYSRTTVVESVDFRCDGAVTSVFAMSAWNPGWAWKLGPVKLSGGQAYVFFDAVGGVDICLWANDYTVLADYENDVLIVDVERLDARRPALMYDPVVLAGKEYQTLELNSLDQDMIANANIDRVVYEGVRNFFSSDDESYMLTQTIQLLRFAENELLNTTCMDEALVVVRAGLQEHFSKKATDLGLSEVELNMPTGVDIPDQSGHLDTGETVLERYGNENCHVVSWKADELAG